MHVYIARNRNEPVQVTEMCPRALVEGLNVVCLRFGLVL